MDTDLAQLVCFTNIFLGFVAVELVDGGYKPTNMTGGGPPCSLYMFILCINMRNGMQSPI